MKQNKSDETGLTAEEAELLHYAAYTWMNENYDNGKAALLDMEDMEEKTESEWPEEAIKRIAESIKTVSFQKKEGEKPCRMIKTIQINKGESGKTGSIIVRFEEPVLEWMSKKVDSIKILTAVLPGALAEMIQYIREADIAFKITKKCRHATLDEISEKEGE